MSYHSGYPQPLGPLSVGNVINAAIRLYRDRFKASFKVSLKAGLWSICPFVIFFAFILINSLLLTQVNSAIIFLFILLNIVIAIFAFIYCSAKYFTNLVLISRLAFRELINHPETVVQAHLQIRSKMFLFWRVNLLVGLLLFLISLGLGLAQVLLFDLPASLNSGVFGAFWKLIGNLVYFVFYTWFYSRYFIADVPLAIENNMSHAIHSIERSWQLTKGSAWRITLIISVAFLITIPIYGLVLLPIFLFFVQLFYHSSWNFETETFSPFLPMSILILVLVTLFAFLFINVLIAPFWQAIKSVVYYDLRSRREGLEIELRSTEF